MDPTGVKLLRIRTVDGIPLPQIVRHQRDVIPLPQIASLFDAALMYYELRARDEMVRL